MNVCFLSHSAGLLGAERALLELVRGLKERNVRPSIILPEAGPMQGRLKKMGIRRIETIPLRNWFVRPSTRYNIGTLIKPWPQARQVAECLREWGCDLVYTNTAATPVGAMAARITDLPHVWHLHELANDSHGMRFMLGEAVSHRLIGQLSELCITPSQTVTQHYSRIPTAKLRTVYYSVDVPDGIPSEGKRSDGFQFVTVGSLSPDKNVGEAIRMVRRLRDKGHPVDLKVLGDGPEQHVRKLRNLVAQEELGNHVHFSGFVEDPFPSMKAADALVFCSRHEAFGRVVAEAMKLGTPVIAARSGGPSELIEHGKTGLLYTPGDEEGLAEEAERLILDEGLRGRLRTEAQTWSRETFTTAAYAGQIVEELRVLLPEAGSTVR